MNGAKNISVSLRRVFVLAMLLVLRSSPAFAQAEADSPDQNADVSGTISTGSPQESLVDEGLHLRDQGADEEALAVFEKARSLQEDARVVAQIAFAEQALGRWVESYRHLLEALGHAEHPWIATNRSVLEKELRAMEDSIARVEVRCQQAGVSIMVNGRNEGLTPLREAVIVLPGTVVIRADRDGYLSITREVMAAAGKVSRAEINLVGIPPSGETSPIVANHPNHHRPRAPAKLGSVGSHRRPLWLVVAGGGALLAASSLIPWTAAETATIDLKKACGDVEGCTETEFRRERAAIEDLDLVSSALLIGGVGISIAGAAAYILWDDERSTQPLVDAAISPRGVFVTSRVAF